MQRHLLLLTLLSTLWACTAANEGTPAKAGVTPKGEFQNSGGMWVPAQLNTQEHAAQLEELGLAIDPAALADPLSYPLGAVVHLGGCSASFVSPEGLVITNHHCVTGSLQYNSTPEKNLFNMGYVAASRAHEKWNGPGSRVYVTQKLTDVTERMRKGLEAIEDPQTRYLEVENREKQLLAECEKDRPNLRCQVASYDAGTTYLLIERLEIKDVRLVYAPPGSIGRFGGEIDNWMWPRHTGDFSFYRAYVGPDGKPAEYSEDNVPYQPKHYLKLPSEPLRQGDLVFVAGYPGRTYRNYTAAEAEETVEWAYPRRIKMCQDFLAALARAAEQDKDAAIRAEPFKRGLENYLKYTKGALEGLREGGVAEDRAEAEKAVREMAPADLFSQLDAVFAEQRATRTLDSALGEIARGSSLLGRLDAVVRMAHERPKADADRKPGFQERDWKRLEESQTRLDRTYHRINDIEVLTTAFIRMKEGLTEYPRVFRALLEGEASPETIRSAVVTAFEKTALEDTAKRLELLKSATVQQIEASDDPLLKLARAMRQDLAELEKRRESYLGRMLLLRSKYLEYLRKAAGREVAPDANSTLRVTYGTVRGYSPKKDAPVYVPFTTVNELTKKVTGKPPFESPNVLVEAISSAPSSGHADSALTDVPVNFLSDLDITGGNSGSATLNRKGEIVGLAFDGNYEAMASDWMFMPSITRAIHVDIRYAQWVMEILGGAEHLLAEMRGAQSAASE